MLHPHLNTHILDVNEFEGNESYSIKLWYNINGNNNSKTVECCGGC